MAPEKEYYVSSHSIELAHDCLLGLIPKFG